MLDNISDKNLKISLNDEDEIWQKFEDGEITEKERNELLSKRSRDIIFKGLFDDLDPKEAEARKEELLATFKGQDLYTAIEELKQGRPYGEVLSGTIKYEKY